MEDKLSKGFGELNGEINVNESEQRGLRLCSKNDFEYEHLDRLLSSEPIDEKKLGIYPNYDELKKAGKKVKFCLSPQDAKIIVYVTNEAKKENVSSCKPEECKKEKLLRLTKYRKSFKHKEVLLAKSIFEVFSTYQEAIDDIEKNVLGNNSKDSINVELTCPDACFKKILVSYLACKSYQAVLLKNIMVKEFENINGNAELGLAMRIFFLLERFYFMGVVCSETQNQTNSRLANDMGLWLDMAFFGEDCVLLEKIKKNTRNYNPEIFWTLLYRYLLSGKTSLSRSLLYCHPNYSLNVRSDLNTKENSLHYSPYMYLSMLIKCVPTTDGEGEKEVELISKWREYIEEYISQDIIKMIESYEERIYFLETLEILRGSENVILGVTNSWRHALSGLYLYAYRGLQHSNINLIVDKVKHMAFNTTMDAIEISILSGDFITAVALLPKIGWWFSIHLIDIIYHSSMFNQNFSISKKVSSMLSIDNVILEIRSWYIFNYSELLLTSKELWHIGLEYIWQCKSLGKDYCSAFVKLLPISTYDSLEKVLMFCNKHSLITEAKHIKLIYRLHHKLSPIHHLMNKLNEHASVNNLISSLELLDTIISDTTENNTLQSIFDSMILECQNDIMKQRVTMLLTYALLLQQYKLGDYAGALKSMFCLFKIRYFPLWCFYMLNNGIADLLKNIPKALLSNEECIEIIYHKNMVSELLNSENVSNASNV